MRKKKPWFFIENCKRSGANIGILRRYIDTNGDTYNFKICVLPHIMKEVKWFTLIFKRDDLKKYRKLYKKLYRKPLKAIGVFIINNTGSIKKEVYDLCQQALKDADELLKQEKEKEPSSLTG